ncbi:MAG TPA: EscU/YscU/HrcU family type III secretion system export apparatus switch protein [Nocardioides sp.]
MSDSAGEKTEKPTAKKNKENRKEGQVPRTQELGGWASMMVVALALPPLLGRELSALIDLLRGALRAAEDPTVPVALAILREGLLHTFFALLLLGAAVMVMGVGAALAQGGFFLATKSVKPTFAKLNPIKGAKRIFGTQALWEGGKMLIKSSLVAILVYGAIQSMMPLLGGYVPIETMLSIVGDHALGLIRNIAIAGLVMAGADYAMARRRIGKQTRMSKDEVKQENKQTEGDPMLKGAIRSRQLAASRNRMLADVVQADVVLVNPTHVAVALAYDPVKGAPRVVARGAGVIAAKIRETAAGADVPLVRDIALARALHSSTKVGQEIPPELFAAVAQILAFVISRRGRGHVGGTHRSPRSESELPAVPVAGRRRRTPAALAAPA